MCGSCRARIVFEQGTGQALSFRFALHFIARQPVGRPCVHRIHHIAPARLVKVRHVFERRVNGLVAVRLDRHFNKCSRDLSTQDCIIPSTEEFTLPRR